MQVNKKNEDFWKELLTEIDKDQDGKISLEEFVDAIIN
jgi:Ca2+-binding EF-hand superfamily protein